MTDDHAGRGGPPLLAPAVSWAAATLVAAALHPGSRPGDAADVMFGLVAAHPTSTRISALALLASAIPFVVWTAAAVHRLHRLGVRVAGPSLGLAGGLLAAVMLAVSGVAAWGSAAAVVPGGAPVVAALQAVAFAAGGPGFAVAFGLLIAGVSVPALLGGLIPRALAWTGLVLAAVSVLAVLGMVATPLQYLLPVVRFGGLIWMLAVSVTLPVARPRAGVPAASSA